LAQVVLVLFIASLPHIQRLWLRIVPTMVTSVCGIGVQDNTARSARKLMCSQTCICLLLVLTVTLPNVFWQMIVAGGVRHNDIAKTAIDEILANSTVIESFEKAFPALKDVNLTKIKDEWLDAASKANKDQTTIVLVVGCILVLVFPLICVCLSRSAIKNNSSSSLGCICCFEGLFGWCRFFTWFVPLAIAAAVCFHLKDDRDFLKCEEIVPWVQNRVTETAVLSANVSPRNVSTALLALSAPHMTLTGVIKEIFAAGGVNMTFKTSFLDEISKRLNTTQVDQLTKEWLVELKVKYPGVLPLSNVTANFFHFMFNNTGAQQIEFCKKGVDAVYKVAGVLAIILAVFAGLSLCEVFTCCFGSCEAWQAKNTLNVPGGLFVGLPVAMEEQKPLISQQSNEAPIGSNGVPPARNGGLSCCASLGNCGRR